MNNKNLSPEPFFYNTHPFSPKHPHDEQCAYDTGYAGPCGCVRTNPIHNEV
jgi:hypothetical protein